MLCRQSSNFSQNAISDAILLVITLAYAYSKLYAIFFFKKLMGSSPHHRLKWREKKSLRGICEYIMFWIVMLRTISKLLNYLQFLIFNLKNLLYFYMFAARPNNNYSIEITVKRWDKKGLMYDFFSVITKTNVYLTIDNIYICREIHLICMLFIRVI